jgi:Fe-S-cluster containining protein
MTKRRLPLAVDESVGKTEVLRSDLSSDFEMQIRSEVPKHGLRVTCTAGCASCCYHPVVISILEGILIYRWMVERGKWTSGIREKLKSSADQQFGTEYHVWLKAMIPCPLLDDENRCSVYQTRPLICRVYYAVSDPHYCHPHRISNEFTKLLPRDNITDTFHGKQAEILRKHKLQLINMPIGAALLMAEKVCNDEVDLESVDRLLIKEYGEKT